MARRHRPLEVVIDGRHECSVCGRPTLGVGAALRHEGEAVPVVVPDPEDARSVERALDVARAVVRRMRGADEEEIAHAITEALYTQGHLRQRRGPVRYNVVLADPEPREPDHAERAAGMTGEVTSAA